MISILIILFVLIFMGVGFMCAIVWLPLFFKDCIKDYKEIKGRLANPATKKSTRIGLIVLCVYFGIVLVLGILAGLGVHIHI